MAKARRRGSRTPAHPGARTRPTVTPASPTPAPVTEPDQYVAPPDGASYPLMLRGESFAPWRSMIGAFFGLVMFLLFTSVVSQAVVYLGYVVVQRDVTYQVFYADAFAFRNPLGMLATNLGIATLIPIAVGLIMVMHQVRPRWLFSVAGGIRWRSLIGCLVIAAVALNGVLLLSASVSKPLVFAMQPGFWSFLPIILLTSPIQAAAEEIFFRGYLMQALGSLVRTPWFGVVVSSVIFALLHGTQNLPLFIDRLAFGLLAAVLVWKTGGLEAGIAAHVINNVCAYLIAGLTGSIAELKAIQQIGWIDAAFDVGGFAVFAALAFAYSRLLKLPTTVQLTPIPSR